MDNFNTIETQKQCCNAGGFVESGFSYGNVSASNGWDSQIIPLASGKPKVIDSFPPEMYANGNINICFLNHIPGFFERMQPVIGKVYSAKPHYRQDKLKAKLYFIIRLDNGKPLIVYPGEFKWIEGEQAA